MAVALKTLGYKNIAIYNGGLKDWVRSGLPVVSIDPLPDYKAKFISAEELKAKLSNALSRNCRDSRGNPLVTLIDMRSSLHFKNKKGADLYQILTNCPIKTLLLDDFINNEEVIRSIPRKGLVVSVCETGNRDIYLMKYLSKFGYTNVVGLQFGMRVWLKKDYPTQKLERAIGK